MLNLDLILKNNELCLVGRSVDRGGMHEAGIYLRDTRFVRDIELTLNGLPLEVLDMRRLGDSEAIIHSTNARAEVLDGWVEPSTIALEQRMVLDDAITMALTVETFAPEPVSLSLGVSVATDFRDMFDVRGMHPKRRSVLDASIASDTTSVCLSATNARGERQGLGIEFERQPAGLHAQTLDDTASMIATFDLGLQRGTPVQIAITLRPEAVGAPVLSVDEVARSSGFQRSLEIQSDLPRLEPFIDRCDRDLALLQTSFPDGSIPAAGIPWYVAPFGRDSLIVALQTMHVYPQRAAATLRVLAALQGAKLDPYREEEPGKILHEMRYGDMARTGQIPHTPYYGSIDSTPLFVMTFAQAYLWHRDNALYDDLIEHVRRALTWMDDYGDVDGDGLVEFGETAGDGVHITQQGWKDSGDSLHFADGREVTGPFALVEVQGYVFAAFSWLADAVESRGDHDWSLTLRDKAERVRRTVEERFWMEDLTFYAQALDGRKQPVDAISSNPGHLLFCGLPTPERAALVAARLSMPDMLCSWGIRTLSSEMGTYNPMSYHNGSVWPHDNSLIMWGARTYGLHDLAMGIAERTLELSSYGPQSRLSELCCGFDGPHDIGGPVDYPVSCSPQAWAAASGHLMIRTFLGVSPDAGTGSLTFDPTMPPAATHLTVSDVSALGRRHRVEVRRTADGLDVSTAVVSD